tara:strand:+ start:470 stop:1159 length:690 start_codon:yes stop_codon:yes gene_type:complete
MPSHHGKHGTSAGVQQGTHSRSRNQGGVKTHHPPSTKTTTHTSSGNGSTKKTINTTNAKNLSLGISIAKGNPLGIAWNILSRPFTKKTPAEKRAANIKKGLDISNPAEMHGYETGYGRPKHEAPRDRPQTTLLTQSVVSSPTADKAKDAHSWDFKAYDNQQAETKPNVYDYNKAPYAKKGKLVRKYATGQEIKNFSKGKRFGPPPLKGPDPQGLQVILENSDYFKKLIG